MLPGPTYLYLTIGVLLLASYTPIISAKPTPVFSDPYRIVINQPQTTIVLNKNLAKILQSYLSSGQLFSQGNKDECSNTVINQPVEESDPPKNDKEKSQEVTAEPKKSSEAVNQTDECENTATTECNCATENNSEAESESDSCDNVATLECTWGCYANSDDSDYEYSYEC